MTLPLRDLFKQSSFIFLTVMLLPASMEGQSAYVEEYLGLEQGLPSLNIRAVTQDSRGAIWIATFDYGLIRYDGAAYKIITNTHDSKPKLSSNHVRDVVVDAKGYLWAIHDLGIDIVDPNSLTIIKFIPVKGSHEAHNGDGYSLHVDNHGDIWAAFYLRGVMHFPSGDPDRGKLVTDVQHIDYVNQSPNGILWCVSQQDGVFIWENGEFKPLQAEFFPVRKSPYTILRIIENQDGFFTGIRTIIPKGEVKAYRINLQTNHFEPGYPEDGISATTSPEISRRILEKASPLSKTGLFTHSIRNFKDNCGIIWVALGYGGLFKLKPRVLNFFTCPDLNGVSLRGMIEDASGNIYISSYNGIFHYFPQKNRAKRITETFFFHLTQFRNGTFTGTTEGSGFGNFKVTPPVAYDPIPGSKIDDKVGYFSSLSLDSDWLLIGNKYLYRVRPRDWAIEPFCELPTKPTAVTFSFAQSSDSQIWVGTTEGVFVVSRDRVCEAPAIREDYRLGPGSRINDIFEDADGKLWFATHTYGLLCYDPQTKQIQAFDKNSGFSSNETYKIASSHGGNLLWVSTFDGIQCIQLINGKIYLFNEFDGTSGDEFNTGSFLQTRSGEFYFGGVKGLTRFNPDEFHPSLSPPPYPYITEVYIEDVSSSNIVHINYPKNDTVVQLSYTQNTINFHFGSNSYFRPETNNYYIKLEGADQKWIPSGSISNFKYYRLPPGRYTFKVKLGSNVDRIWSMSFVIKEVYYKQWWFIVLLSLFTIGLIIGGFWIAKMQREHDEKLKKTIANDLHNAFGGKISSISNLLYIINRLKKNGQPFESELEKAYNLTLTVHGTISDAIWALSHRRENHSVLSVRMEDYADKWLKSAHIKVVFESNNNRWKKALPFSVEYKILSIYKELLGNILKHTVSEKVNIRYVINSDKSIDLIVKNQFSERKSDVPSGGSGLSIIEHDVKQLGGTMKITAEKNSFEVSIKFDKPFYAKKRRQ